MRQHFHRKNKSPYNSENIHRIIDGVEHIFLHRIRKSQCFLKADFIEKTADGRYQIFYSFCFDEDEYNKLDPKREFLIKTTSIISETNEKILYQPTIELCCSWCQKSFFASVKTVENSIAHNANIYCSKRCEKDKKITMKILTPSSLKRDRMTIDDVHISEWIQLKKASILTKQLNKLIKKRKHGKKQIN